MENNIYDLIIVGGGPAGASAAVYAARKRLKTVLILKEWGGQSIVSEDIQNWIGTPHLSGNDLAKNLEKHVKEYAEDVVEIQGESLSNAKEVFDQIKTKFDLLMSDLDEITNGIDIIADAKTQTIDSIQSISAVSQQTAAASEEVTETANRQLKQVEKLNTAASDLNANSAELSEAMNIFKI